MDTELELAAQLVISQYPDMGIVYITMQVRELTEFKYPRIECAHTVGRIWHQLRDEGKIHQ